MRAMSMSGISNGVELCMVFKVLDGFCGEAQNSLQYGRCVESQSFLGDVRDCMDSVCKRFQCGLYDFLCLSTSMRKWTQSSVQHRI